MIGISLSVNQYDQMRGVCVSVLGMLIHCWNDLGCVASRRLSACLGRLCLRFLVCYSVCLDEWRSVFSYCLAIWSLLPKLIVQCHLWLRCRHFPSCWASSLDGLRWFLRWLVVRRPQWVIYRRFRRSRSLFHGCIIVYQRIVSWSTCESLIYCRFWLLVMLPCVYCIWIYVRCFRRTAVWVLVMRAQEGWHRWRIVRYPARAYVLNLDAESFIFL